MDEHLVGLTSMLETQKELQNVFDARSSSSDPRESCEYIKDMVFAAGNELHELVDETDWKPWTRQWNINTDEARGEWIDAWHFMLNLANKLGMDADTIFRMYHDKARVNHARAAALTDPLKCKRCKRALDDPKVKCTTEICGYYTEDDGES